MIPPAITPTAQQLEMLSNVVRDVARFQRLSPEDTQEFAHAVQRWVSDGHYDIFNRYTGRSSFRTYLTVIVTRLLLDWRNGHLASSGRATSQTKPS